MFENIETKISTILFLIHLYIYRISTALSGCPQFLKLISAGVEASVASKTHRRQVLEMRGPKVLGMLSICILENMILMKTQS